MTLGKHKIHLLLLALVAILASCTISYKLTGASIDYSKVRTVSVSYFPNEAALVDPDLSQEFTEALKDKFQRQTRLTLVQDNGDLHFEGEITGYDIKPISIQADALAAQTRLTIRVQARFVNNSDPEQDFDSSFSGYADFDASQSIEDVKADLRSEIIEIITEDIFNKSVANW